MESKRSPGKKELIPKRSSSRSSDEVPVNPRFTNVRSPTLRTSTTFTSANNVRSQQSPRNRTPSSPDSPVTGSSFRIDPTKRTNRPPPVKKLFGEGNISPDQPSPVSPLSPRGSRSSSNSGFAVSPQNGQISPRSLSSGFAVPGENEQRFSPRSLSSGFAVPGENEQRFSPRSLSSGFAVPPQDRQSSPSPLFSFNGVNAEQSNGVVDSVANYAYNEKTKQRLYIIGGLNASNSNYFIGYLADPGEVITIQTVISLMANGLTTDIMSHPKLRIVRDSEDNAMEVMVWKKLIKAEQVTPDVNLDFYIQGRRLVVMRALRQLDPGQDDYHEVAADVLQLLSVINQFGCHNRINFSTIMCDPLTGRYHLINMNRVAIEQKEYGYLRKSWAEHFSSQVPELGQVTTRKYDLIELIYTLNALQKRSSQLLSFGSNSWSNQNEEWRMNFRHVASEPMKSALDYIRSFPDNQVPDNVYEGLMEIINQ